MKIGNKKIEDIDFHKIQSKLTNVPEFEQVIVKAYKLENNDEDCFVEALIYPSDSLYKKFDGERGDIASDIAVYLKIQEIIKRKTYFNKRNAKVNRVIFLDEKL